MTAEELAELRQMCDRAEDLEEDPKAAIYDRIDARTECGQALPRAIREIERLRAELDRLHGLMLGEGEVKHMTYSPEKGCEVEIEHWAVKHIARSLFETLGDAPNFVTMTVSHPEHGAVEIVVRRPESKPVAAVLDELRAENAALQKQLTETNSHIEAAVKAAVRRVRNDRGSFMSAGEYDAIARAAGYDRWSQLMDEYEDDGVPQ